jgi:hypothetical protein
MGQNLPVPKQTQQTQKNKLLFEEKGAGAGVEKFIKK